MQNILIEQIKAVIKKNGMITFDEFMQQALYAPNLGYYSSSLPKFGPHGDFITAPELTPLFGYAIANQCLQVMRTLNNPIIFEFGAGTGRLCVDILIRLEACESLPSEYHILELSASLKKQQQATINQEIPHLANKIKWLTTWPTQPFHGIMLANEVLDAMPVSRFVQTASGILESHVALNAAEELVETFIPSSNQRLLDHIHALPLPNVAMYQSEANLWINDWIKQCSAVLDQGLLLILDYGFSEHEYYHPDRSMGTLMCHYQHRAHTNPFIHIGAQDITAHVDFTHVATAAVKAGLHVSGFTQQGAFLLGNNILAGLSTITDPKQQLIAKQAVLQLIEPQHMGELFKVIALTKNIDETLTGFQAYDKRASL